MADGALRGRVWARLMLGVASAGVTPAAFGAENGADALSGYRAAWSSPQVTDRIREGIEKYRKGDAVLVVKGPDGSAAANAEVEVRQITHEFLFGCNCFFLGHLKTEAKNREYEERFARLFNFASAPFYWSDLEPEPGKPRFTKDSPFVYRRPPPDLAVEFARRYGITLKGHPLMWDHFYPAWLPKDKQKVAEALSQRMAKIAERYAETIKVWDVVNETLMDKPANVVPDDYAAWCFREADRRFRADNVLMSNEAPGPAHRYSGTDGKQSPYYLMLSNLRKRGLRFDGIGLQFHIPDTRKVQACQEYAPDFLFKVYDLYSEFGKPLFITEMSVGTARSGAEARAVQAEITRNFYRLFFSVERMAGITWWNLGDGMAHKWSDRNDENSWQAGLLDENLQPKEAYRVLDELINGEWKTQATGRTGADGVFSFRGFHGKYRVTVRQGETKDEFEVDLSKAGGGRHELRLKAAQARP